jgi:integrase/recombinase XerD
MTSARVWQIVTGAVKAAGITKRLSPPSLRHSYAIERLKVGASPVIVQKLLGHSSLSTTQKYIDIPFDVSPAYLPPVGNSNWVLTRVLP